MTVEDRHLVVVGASLAGLRAVEEAREQGHRGAITLIGAEDHLPYDRPPLSKAHLDGVRVDVPPFLAGVEDLANRLDVRVRLGDPAEHLDTTAREVTVAGEVVGYDALLIATGSHPRTLPGTQHMAGVHTLRTVEDANAIASALDAGARTVVVGAGFIGAEVASAARRRGLPVTVVEAAPTPLERALGRTAGAALSRLHTEHGTDLCCGVGVGKVLGTDRVTGVELADGSTVPADLVVVGIGADPATRWLEDSGLELDAGVVCDARLSAAPGIWAAGDVARWWSEDFHRHLRLEHWTNASDQGAHAATNAVHPDRQTAYRHVPYAWSDWYGQRIQVAGMPTGEPVLVFGDWSADALVALYRDEDRVAGVLTVNRRADVMKHRSLIARGGSWAEALELADRRAAAAR